MPGPAAVLGIDVLANVKQAQASLAAVQAQLKETAAVSESSAAKSAAAWTSAGKRMETIGKSMTKYVTIPAVAAGAAAVKLASDFDKSMLLIQTQAGASAGEVKKLSEEVLAFAKSGKTQFSPNDLAQALYSIESAGIHGAKAMDTLKASAKLATVGQSDLASTTKALAAAQKTGIKGSADLKKAIGTLNAAVGQGQMHMDDLVSAMGTGFLSTASSMGLSLKDVTGALAELTKQGMPAAQSATRLRMTFSLMAAPTQAAADAMKAVGLSSTDLATTMRNQGLLPALEMLNNHLQGLSDVAKTQALSAMFGGGRTSAAIIALLNNTGDLDTILQNITKHSGEVNDSFKKMQEEPSVRLERVWSQMQAVLIDMGNKLIPKLIPLLQKVASVLETVITAFTDAPSWVQDFLIGAVVLGPFIRGLGLVAKAYGAIKVAATGAAAAQGAAGAAGGVGAAGAAGGAAEAGAGATALRLAGPVTIAVAGGLALGVGLDKIFPQGIIPKIDPNKGPHTPQEWQNIITMGVDDAKISKDIGPQAHGKNQPSIGPPTQPFDPSSPTGTAQALAMQKQRTFGAAALPDIAGMLGPFRTAGATISDILGMLQKKYGDLASAADEMTKKQSHDFLSLAISAKLPKPELQSLTLAFAKAGNLSKADMKDLSKVTGLSMKQIRDAADGTAKDYKKAQSDIRGANQDSMGSIHKFTGTIDSIKQWSKDTVHAFASASKASADGTNAIKNNANSALKGLGVGKSIDFSTFTLQGTPGAHQRGGRIVPGKGSGDTVPAMLEPGEFVLNREAVRSIGNARLEALNKALPRFAKGGTVGGMSAMIAEANKFERHHFPYSFGGGHGSFGIQPVDCSGAVSDVLHAGGLLSAPMDTVALANWGKPGKGPLTVWTRPIAGAGGHTVMSLNGRVFGTSSLNPGGGAGWVDEVHGNGASLVSGAVTRTMDVVGGVMGAVAQKIKRQVIRGPRGALGGAAQMGLDHVWQAANKYIAKHTPSGKFGGPGNALPLGNIKGSLASEAAQIAKGLRAPGRAALALFEALIAESGMGTTSSNVLQLIPSTAAAAGISQSDAKGQIASFLTNAYGFGPGAISLAKSTNEPAYMIAQDVQRSGAGQASHGAANYGVQQGPASALLSRYKYPGFKDGGTVPGPIGRPQMVVAHGGETITPANKTKRYQITITNWKQGTGYMEEIADTAVNGQRRLGNQLSRMSRA